MEFLGLVGICLLDGEVAHDRGTVLLIIFRPNVLPYIKLFLPQESWGGIMGTVLLIHFSNNRTRNKNVIKI